MKKTGDIQYILFCVTILTVLILASCAKEEEKVEPTFSSLWDNVFYSCGASSCHNVSPNIDNGTNLGPDLSTKTSFYDGVFDIRVSSYVEWVASAGYSSGCEANKIVEPRNANVSMLAATLVESISISLADDTCLPSYGYHSLNDSVINDQDTADALTKWINDGAKNN